MLLKLQKNYNHKTPQKFAVAYLVHNNPQNPLVDDAFRLFNILDKHGNGKISKLELKEGLEDLSLNKDLQLDAPLNRIFNMIDADNNGFIEYEEFVSGCINKEKFINDEIIKMSILFFWIIMEKFFMMKLNQL
jgi:calcium-dependent protein kinase